MRWPPDLTELTSQNLVDSTELSLLTLRQQEIVYFLEHNDPSGEDGTQPFGGNMNDEQRECVQAVVRAVDDGQPFVGFLSAYAGCGKTFVERAICIPRAR